MGNLFTFWIPFAVLLPLIVGCLGALPAWLNRKAIMGNLIASAIIAAIVFFLIWQQYGVYVQAQTACGQGLSPCPPTGVDMYTPFLMLVLLGWLDVFFVLIISGVVEDNLKRRQRFDRSRL